MRAGGAAVCDGEVVHRRFTPRRHEFRYPVSYVWLDPDRPDRLCGRHPLWSDRRPAPARFRRRDYGIARVGSLADEVRADLQAVLGRPPAGEVRMLTQVRRWGWLFNPITVYLAWDVDPDIPVGAVLEVTNTPWKERHRYVVALEVVDGAAYDAAVGRTAKALHVSPFLDEDFEYAVRLSSDGDRTLRLGIDVVRAGAEQPTLTTRLDVDRVPATRESLGRALVDNLLATHRVSFGIHLQALRLWWKRVPFVSHPSKRPAVREHRPPPVPERERSAA